jgi:hypothetical protein
MKKLTLTLVLAVIMASAFASEESKTKEEKTLHRISNIELDMLVDLVDDDGVTNGEYSVEVYDYNGKLIQKDNYSYGTENNVNTIGYRSDYIIRMTFENGMTHDFILKN